MNKTERREELAQAFYGTDFYSLNQVEMQIIDDWINKPLIPQVIERKE